MSHKTFSHASVFRRDRKRGFMNNTEVLLKLEQERLEKIRQDIHLRHLLNAQRPSLRSRTAQTLHRLALRLYPEIELYSNTETQTLSLQHKS